MKIITKTILSQLIANARNQLDALNVNEEIDFKPVVKLFTPDANATWLLTEIDLESPNIAYGLCDLGLGSPEIGNVDLREISRFRGALGLPVERDLHFQADKTISEYAKEARKHGRIVT